MVVIFFCDPNYDIKIIEKKKISINIVNLRFYYFFAEHVLNVLQSLTTGKLEFCQSFQAFNLSSVAATRCVRYNVITSGLTSELMLGNYLNPSNDHVNEVSI